MSRQRAYSRWARRRPKGTSAAGLEVDTAVWTHAWSVAELDRPQEGRLGSISLMDSKARKSKR